MARSLDLRPYLGKDYFTTASAGSADNTAAKLAKSGALLVGADQGQADEQEQRLLTVWSPVPDTAFSVMDICQRAQAFFLDTGALPANAEELIRHDFSRNRLGMEQLRRADHIERIRLLGKYFNPATGELYSGFESRTAALSLRLRVVPKSQWDASYADTADWTTASGQPSPISHAMHLTVHGSNAERVLIERTLFFGR